jgi:hypothetical protein
MMPLLRSHIDAIQALVRKLVKAREIRLLIHAFQSPHLFDRIPEPQHHANGCKTLRNQLRRLVCNTKADQTAVLR